MGSNTKYVDTDNIDAFVSQIFTVASKEVLQEEEAELFSIIKQGLSDLGCNGEQIEDILKLAKDNPNNIGELNNYLKQNDNIKTSTTTTQTRKSSTSVMYKNTEQRRAVAPPRLKNKGGVSTYECDKFFGTFKEDCQSILEFINEYILHGFSNLFLLLRGKVREYIDKFQNTNITFEGIYEYVTTNITSLKTQIKTMFTSGFDKMRSFCTTSKCGVLQLFLALTVVPICISFLGFIQFICFSYVTYMRSNGAMGSIVSHPPAVLTIVTLPLLIPLLKGSEYLLNSSGCESDMIDNICNLLNYILESLLSIAILNKNCSKYLYNIIECTSQLLIDKVNGVKAKDEGVSENEHVDTTRNEHVDATGNEHVDATRNEHVDATGNDIYNANIAKEINSRNNIIESDKNKESDKIVKYKDGMKSGCNREINPILKKLCFTLVEHLGNIIMTGVSTLHIIDLAYALVKRLTEKIKKQSMLAHTTRDIIFSTKTGGILHKKIYKKKRYTKQKNTKKHRIRKSKKIKNKKIVY